MFYIIAAGISSTEIATGLIAALVTLFGGVGMIILIVICLSFRKWLRKLVKISNFVCRVFCFGLFNDYFFFNFV